MPRSLSGDRSGFVNRRRNPNAGSSPVLGSNILTPYFTKYYKVRSSINEKER